MIGKGTLDAFRADNSFCSGGVGQIGRSVAASNLAEAIS